MNDLLQKAYERREQLRKELRTIEEFILRLEGVDVPDDRPDFFSRQQKAELRTPKKGLTSSELKRVLAMASEIILEAGRPLTRSQILRALEERGIEIYGGDKAKVLGTNLWRSGRFRSVKPSGYWPEDVPVPEPYKGKIKPRT